MPRQGKRASVWEALALALAGQYGRLQGAAGRLG